MLTEVLGNPLSSELVEESPLLPNPVRIRDCGVGLVYVGGGVRQED